jgi:TolB protein
MVLGVLVPAGAGTAPSNGRIWFMESSGLTTPPDVMSSLLPDGSDLQVAFAIDTGWVWYDATLSPDGARLAVAQFRLAGDHGTRSRLLIVDAADGGSPEIVFPGANVGYGSVGWYPDGSRLLFTRADLAGDGRARLFSSLLDGSDLTRIGGGAKSSASLSPDMTRIVYGDRHGRIGVIDADGSDQTLLVDRGWNAEPAWSPDGATIAFVRRVQGSNDIFTMAPDGTGRERVTETGRDELGPVWSPDGTRILFPRIFDVVVTRTDLWTMAPDGSSVQRLTDDAVFQWPVGWAAA